MIICILHKKKILLINKIKLIHKKKLLMKIKKLSIMKLKNSQLIQYLKRLLKLVFLLF